MTTALVILILSLIDALDQRPPVSDATALLPDAATCEYNRQATAGYVQELERYVATRFHDVAAIQCLTEQRRLANLWDLMSNCARPGWCVNHRRTWLAEYRDRVGLDAYYDRQYPATFPWWLYQKE